MSDSVNTFFAKVGSVGVKFKIDCSEDISAATTKKLIFVNPLGTVYEKDATIEDTQYLVYTTVLAVDGTTLLNVAGLWKVIPYIDMPAFTGYGRAFDYYIAGKLQ